MSEKITQEKLYEIIVEQYNNKYTTVYDMSLNNVNATIVNATSGTNTSGAVYQADTAP